MLVAIVGATGSGKSTALRIAAQEGYRTMNMDEYVHELYRAGNEGYSAVLKTFGPTYVNEQGVNRTKLADMVFKNKRDFEQLKRIVYPFVAEKLADLKGDWVIEMPAYTNDPDFWRPYFSFVILIKADKENRKLRIAQKISRVGNLSTSTVENYINLVNPHLPGADFIVDNDGSAAEFRLAVKNVLNRIFKP